MLQDNNTILIFGAFLTPTIHFKNISLQKFTFKIENPIMIDDVIYFNHNDKILNIYGEEVGNGILNSSNSELVIIRKENGQLLKPSLFSE